MLIRRIFRAHPIWCTFVVAGLISGAVITLIQIVDARMVAFRAGPTRVIPVHKITMSNGVMDITYLTPNKDVQGIRYRPSASSYSPASNDEPLIGKVKADDWPSEIEWYGEDDVWTIGRVKQVRLNKAQVEAMGMSSFDRH